MTKIILIFIVVGLIQSCENNNRYHFALVTDAHVAENTSGAADLRLAVADINRQRDIEFVLVSGDITDLNIGNNLRVAKQILDSLMVPYYIIPGNHDNYDRIHEYSENIFQEDYGSFTLGNKSLFYIRGGYSVDKAYRNWDYPNKSWWEEEEMTWGSGMKLVEKIKEEHQLLTFHGQ